MIDMSQVKVREAVISDLGSLSLLFEDHFIEQAVFNPLFQPNPEFSYAEFVRGLLASGAQLILVAEEHEKVIGFIHINIQQGGQVVAFRPPVRDSIFRRLTPVRVLRRIVSDLHALLERRFSQPPLFKPVVMAYLGNIYVVREKRGLGVGRKLVEKGMEWAGQRNVDLMFLQVHAGNQAGLKFWEKAGFEPGKHIMVRKIRPVPR